jgi:hypothetical protein
MAEKLEQGRFQRFQDIQFIDAKIREAITKGNARLVISMPPRHGKSWLTSLYTPAWFLSLWPDRNVILTSYEASFAASWGRRIRNFVQEHCNTLKVDLAEDSLASDRWNRLEGGGMITAGIGGPITGRGGHLIIVDNPVKNWEEAASETQRQKAIDWFNSTMRSTFLTFINKSFFQVLNEVKSASATKVINPVFDSRIDGNRKIKLGILELYSLNNQKISTRYKA